MARTLRLIFALVVALIGGLLIAPPAHAAGTNTVIYHVTDPDGAPIAFTGSIHVGGNSSGNSSTTGELTWNNVADGDYTFSVRSDSMDGYQLWYDGTASGSPTQPAPTQLAGGQTLTITLQFPRLATLSGTVTTSDGDPLPNLAVLVNRGGMVKNATTDADGHYNFGYMRAGNITMSTGSSGAWVAAAATPVTVPTSNTITQDFVLSRGASIDGTVTNAANAAPLGGVTVAAYTLPTVSYVNSTTTDASGHFHLDGLPGATYALRFEDPLGGSLRSYWWSGSAWSSDTATTKTVAAASDVTWNEAATFPNPADYPHSLAGTVTSTTGTPLAGVSMTADDGVTQVPTITDRNGRWALSTGDGSWTIRAEASVTLQSLDNETPWYPQYYATSGVADTPELATAVQVSGASVTDGLDLTLSRSARLTAAVNPSGSSDAVNAVWTPYTTGGAALPSTPADYQGNPLLRPGSYKLLVAGEYNGNALLPRWYGNAASFDAAPTLTLAAGDDVAGSTVSLHSDLAAVSAPTVTGTSAVGGTVTGTTGSWNLETGTTVTTTWTRGGTVLSSASSYQPTPADAGATVEYAVNATNSGFGHTFTKTVTVQVPVPVPASPAKLASKTTLKAKALGKKKVRLTLSVSAAVRASGTVTIRRGSVIVGTAKLVKGKATITVKRQPKGKKSYQATFNGSSQLATSTSKTVKVKVR
ncbi:MAG: hypothetical protein CVT62_07275 [Actinobacteria bacterium HGW-Actinobacteria-2]|nr:MAG: hypothetical protein CVT62_07275 [Actinobacteria bacterium HGW-Actinobacteria-2]